MKKLIIPYLLLASVLMQAQPPVRIGVITDTHYLSEQLMDNGYAAQGYASTSGREIADIPEVLDQVIKDYADSNIDFLFVCGDMAKDGERKSHEDFVKQLKPLQEKGVRVFVVPGNHDINVPNPAGYRGNTTFDTENVSPEQFAGIYASCGYADAMKRDTVSLSYVARLTESVWLLSIDAARYQDYGERTISAGRILPQTEKWVLDVLDEAQGKHIQVVGMMHWGLVEHLTMQSAFFEDYLVADWYRLASLFADRGMKAIFTGHFHANDITEHISDRGSKIYDIETGALCSYPFAYRFVDLYPNKMVIETKNILSTPNNPRLAEDSRVQLAGIARRQAYNKLNGMGLQMPDDVLKPMAEAMSQIFILHLEGDEQMTPELKTALDNLAEQTEDDAFEDGLDFYPADNNVEIAF